MNSKNPSYLLIDYSERAKNLVFSITFHALSNGMTHFKIKSFSDAGAYIFGRFSHGSSLKYTRKTTQQTT